MEADTQPSAAKVVQPNGDAHAVDSDYAKHDVKMPSEHKVNVELIVTIILAVIFLAFGGVAWWFFGYYNQPQKVLADAVLNLATEPSLVLRGEFVIRPTNDVDTPIQQIALNIDSATNGIPRTTNAELVVTFDQEQVKDLAPVSIKLDQVLLADGVLFIQIDGLMAMIDEMGLDEDVAEILTDYLDFIEVIDGEWWRIELPEILSEFEVEESLSTAINEAYLCVLEAGSQVGAEIGELYARYPFIVTTPVDSLNPWNVETLTDGADWHNKYAFAYDRYVLANLINELPNTSAATELIDCYNRAARQFGGDVIRVTDIPEFDADDLDWPDGLQVVFEISTFSHRLRSINAHYETSTMIIDGSVLFSYGEVSILEPREHRSLLELYQAIIEYIEGMFSNIYDEGTYSTEENSYVDF